jgi:heat shock protein HslJ
MKAKISTLIALTTLLMNAPLALNAQDNSPLAGTSWKLTQMAPEALPAQYLQDETKYYPDDIQPFIITFREDGTADLPNGCNVHYLNYSTAGNTILFYGGCCETELYCGGYHEWEQEFISIVRDVEQSYYIELYGCDYPKSLYIGNPGGKGLIFERLDYAATEMVKGTWAIDKLLGLDENVQQYTLTPVNNDFLRFGNFVTFTCTDSFRSYYSAECGNDCFTDVFGKYRIENETTLVLAVDSVIYHCGSGMEIYQQPNEYRDGKEIYFDIIQDVQCKTSPCEFSIKQQSNPHSPTDISELPAAGAIIYPTIAESYLNVGASVNYRIFGLQGVLSLSGFASANQPINVSGLKSGVYLISTVDATTGERRTGKFVKK